MEYNFKVIYWSYAFAIVIGVLLYLTHYEDGYWVVCAPFIPALPVMEYFRRRQSQDKAQKLLSKKTKWIVDWFIECYLDVKMKSSKVQLASK